MAPTRRRSVETGLFPLYYAGRFGNIELATILLAYGANIDQIMSPWSPTIRYNAVTAAAFGGHLDTVRFLLDRGALGTPPPGGYGKWKSRATEMKKNEILSDAHSGWH
jgi:ankyrin repeat protein